MSLDWKYQESFPSRHIGPDAAEQARMLEALGLPSLEALIDQTVPAAIRTKRPLDLGPGTGELDLLEEVRALAQKNVLSRAFIGMGYHDCFLPTVIQRNVLESPGWYTAYTPYQAEIAQGRLEALFNFQTMVTDLTGLEIANASLLDEATAAAEGMALAFHARKNSDCRAFFADALCHPQTLAVLRTRAEPLGIEVRVGDPSKAGFSSGCFGAIVQYPSTDGGIRDLRPMAESVHAEGGLLVVAADLLALTLLTPPGELGADVAVGSTQRFGVPMGYGGPHAAYFSTRAAYVRQMPGRIIGLTQDAEGRPALRMALQTREQHIRRERATSNICTSQVLLAVISSMYAVYHGPEGLTRIAERVHGLTVLLAKGLAELGFQLRHSSFFDTVAVEVGAGKAESVCARAFGKGMLFRKLDEHTVGLALDETTRAADLQAIWDAFAGEAADGKKVAFSPESLGEKVEPRLPGELRRKSAFLTHPVFNTHCSESEMLRYIKRLESKDLSLAQAMIPLGSCTMKLNATTEMIPVTWSKFGRLHPFAPLEQTEGYQRLFADLKRMLAEITGFPAVSLQPNAGSQGEFSGLLAIRGWHASRGEGQRDVCLIPASAHGTNPASAVMAGLKVVVVRCDAQGNIELDDLEEKAKAHESRLAALMVTYPSTHGVFEEEIQRICEIVHAHGGQVYLDGANLNAQVGLCRPSEIGADVCHLNLHKTFCIPHGGGGPGMGPIAAAAHLAPFLPGHPVVPVDGRSEGAVAAAPWGSASILVISWAYIRMMGGEGLKRATEVAILSANYLAQRLSPHFPVLYKGRNGRVAHECILDLRAFKKSAGIEAEDVAKRLIDYGFHAPTLSFPVVGTLMIEPTESEPLAELDRFCEALIAIREEIRQIEEGKQPREGNVLKGAPHPAHLLAAAEWNRPYSREQAVYPTAAVRESKFWPAVGRLDAALGDRNLICSCPPVDSY